MKLNRCKLSKKLQLKLLEFFVAEVTARTSADLLGVQYNTAILFYHKIRLVIEYHLAQEAKELFDGGIELDESYFGGIRKGKRGRGAGGKTAVFGLLKRNGKVYTACVKDTKTDTLMPIITSKIKPDSIVYTDCYKSYNALDASVLSILELTIPKNLQKTLITSTVSKTFGIKPNECLESTTALTRNIFIFLSKNVSFALTTAHHLKSLKH